VQRLSDAGDSAPRLAEERSQNRGRLWPGDDTLVAFWQLAVAIRVTAVSMLASPISLFFEDLSLYAQEI